MKVAVIGAGVLGSCIASELARTGADVTVLDAATPGQGTSATSYGWVNSNTKQPRDYFELNLAGMRLHHEQATPTSTWWGPGGNLEWATEPEDQARLEERLDRLQSWGYNARRITRREALTLEPDIRPPGNDTLFALFPDEGYCYPSLLIAHRLGDARDHGARLITHTQVHTVRSTPAGVTLHTDPAATDALPGFDTVICCVGRVTGDLMRRSHLMDIPMLGPGAHEERTLGYLGTTAPVPARLSHLITTPELNIRPAGGGRLLLQGLTLDPGNTDPGAQADPAAIASELTRRAHQVLNESPENIPCHVQLGHRSLPADGYTVAGFVDENHRVYTLATHSGVTLGPLLGQLVTREATGHPVDTLQPYRPDRFHNQTPLNLTPTPRHAGEQ